MYYIDVINETGYQIETKFKAGTILKFSSLTGYDPSN